MNETTDPPIDEDPATGGSAGGANDPGPGRNGEAGPRPLRRSTTDRKLGGVAGGIGHYLGVDPVIIRVAFVCALVFGGSGAIAYLAAWLLIPNDDGVSHVSSVGTHDARRIAGIALLVIAALVVLGDGSPDDGIVLPFLLIGGGIALVVRRDETSPHSPTGGTWAAETPFLGDVVGSGVAPVDAPPGGRPPVPPPVTPPSGFPTGRVTLGITALLAGLLGLAAAIGIDVSLRAGLLLCLALTGIGLVIGAFTGRSRILLPVAIVLLGAVSLVSALDIPLQGGIGERTHRPTTADAVEDTYELLIGDLVVDLRGLSPDDVRELDPVLVRLGLGQITVWVPDGVTTDVDGRLSAGSATVFGRTIEGGRIDLEGSRSGPEGAPVLHLTFDAGLAEVVVR